MLGLRMILKKSNKRSAPDGRAKTKAKTKLLHHRLSYLSK